MEIVFAPGGSRVQGPVQGPVYSDKSRARAGPGPARRAGGGDGGGGGGVVEIFKIHSDLSYLSDHERSFGNDEPSESGESEYNFHVGEK